MDFSKLSTNGLLMLHSAVWQALAIDDNTIAGQERPYGVRKEKDWREWADAIESELRKREVNFLPISW